MNTIFKQLKWFKWTYIRPFLAHTLIFLFISLFLPSSASAATNRYIALTGADNNNDCADPTTPCATIAYTVGQANPGDVLHLAAGVYTETSIILDKDLTIQGETRNTTIVQAFADPTNNSGNVFSVQASIVINNLTIQHANTTNSFEDGAITVEGDLRLAKCIIRDNLGHGVVANQGYSLVVNECQIRNNSYVGIRHGSYLAVTNSVIESNAWGGIGSDHTFVEINNSRISKNGGCGICGYDSDLSLSSSLVNDNQGGGIGAYLAEHTVIDSIITRNGSDGISADRYSNINLYNTVVSYNQGNGVKVDLGSSIYAESIAVTGNRGHGIYLEYQSEAVLWNSTINNNHSTTCGGGIYSLSVNLGLYNVTITGNKADTHGGGLCLPTAYDFRTSTLNNVTITQNTADYDRNGEGDGGGIYVEESSTPLLYIQNSILAGNQDGSSSTQHPDCSGTFNSQDYNLIQNTTGCTIVGETGHNLLGVLPLLDRLTYNGGLTKTHALLPGSPAINAGNPTVPGSGGNACELADQRGELRDAFCDIGAFEAALPSPPSTPVPTITPTEVSSCMPPNLQSVEAQVVTTASATNQSLSGSLFQYGRDCPNGNAAVEFTAQ